MHPLLSADRFWFFIKRLRERLWVRPLVVCIMSVSTVLAAGIADSTQVAQILPTITVESVESLLSVMASSMLVIATLAVTSMVSAYASTSNSATPRSFPLVVADDVSQNALSTFIGAFIFSIVALTAVNNNYFEVAGHFTIFILTIIVFALVILTFVRWVDSIARLGRLGETIKKVEHATEEALKRKRDTLSVHSIPVSSQTSDGIPIFSEVIGYVQNIDIGGLQACVEKVQAKLMISALPGTFVTPGRPLAYLIGQPHQQTTTECERIVQSFIIGHDRLFDEDPRFGLVVLSEIASRALSPAVNDQGTAINVIGTLVRLFVMWSAPSNREDSTTPEYDRVEIPEISVRDMFDDAFTAIARDGADSIEVSVRLQKALRSLALIDDKALSNAAKYHSRLALKRSEKAMILEEDFAIVKDIASFSK